MTPDDYREIEHDTAAGVINEVGPLSRHVTPSFLSSCSFCGGGEHLVIGPGVSICPECVDGAVQVIGEREATPAPPWLVPLLESTPASVPEPAPLPGGDDVMPRLLEWLDSNEDLSLSDGVFNAIGLVHARAVYGWNQYRTVLQTRNGRDPVEDGRQELGDLLQYVMQAKLEGRNLAPIRRLLPVLAELVGDV